MKKFTYSVLFFFLVANTYANTPLWKTNTSESTQAPKYQKLKKMSGTSVKKQALQPGEEWKPGTCTIFETLDAGKTWEETESYRYEYGNYGLLLSEESQNQKTFYKYDSHGNWIEKITQTAQSGIGSNVVWINSEKNVRAFDNIVPSFQTIKQDFTWDATSNQWVQVYKHEKLITRDEQNNVQSVIVRSYADETNYVDLEGFRVVYEKGVASSITKFAYDHISGSMKADLTLQDIVWEECGQILNVDYMCMDDIRAKSYNISYDGEIVASTTITYNTEGLYSCTKTTKDAFEDYTEIYKYTKLDNNGSYEESVEIEISGNIEEGEKIVEHFNDYKFQTDMIYYMYEQGTWNELETLQMAPSYENDKLMEVIISVTNPETGELEPVEKNVFGEHILSGIDEVKNFNGKIYLNPNDKNLYIISHEPVNYTIHSIDGQQISRGRVSGNESISTEHLNAGAYIILVTNGTSSQSLKFIK